MLYTTEMNRQKAIFAKLYCEKYLEIIKDDPAKETVTIEVNVQNPVLFRVLFDIGELYGSKKTDDIIKKVKI